MSKKNLWWIQLSSSQIEGPFDEETIIEFINTGIISPETKIGRKPYEIEKFPTQVRPFKDLFTLTLKNPINNLQQSHLQIRETPPQIVEYVHLIPESLASRGVYTSGATILLAVIILIVVSFCTLNYPLICILFCALTFLSGIGVALVFNYEQILQLENAKTQQRLHVNNSTWALEKYKKKLLDYRDQLEKTRTDLNNKSHKISVANDARIQNRVNLLAHRYIQNMTNWINSRTMSKDYYQAQQELESVVRFCTIIGCTISPEDIAISREIIGDTKSKIITSDNKFTISAVTVDEAQSQLTATCQEKDKIIKDLQLQLRKLQTKLDSVLASGGQLLLNNSNKNDQNVKLEELYNKNIAAIKEEYEFKLDELKYQLNATQDQLNLERRPGKRLKTTLKEVISQNAITEEEHNEIIRNITNKYEIKLQDLHRELDEVQGRYNLEKLEWETQQVHWVLDKEFNGASDDLEMEEEPPVNVEKIDKREICLTLAKELSKKPVWQSSDFKSLCQANNLRVNYAIDMINEWSDESFGDFLIDENDSEYCINQDIVENI